MNEKIKRILNSVPGPDKEAMEQAFERQASLAKPPGSLGKLEDLSIRLAGMTGRVNNNFDKKGLLVFAADNGVVEEGVSSAPQSVTLSQTVNIAHYRTGVGVLAGFFGCGITVIDVGVNADIKDPKVRNRKIAYGTKNLAKGPAMTREEAEQALMTGIEEAGNCTYDIMGIGEMGIGNTTTSAIVLAILTGISADLVCGRGGLITDASFEIKKNIIRKSIESYQGDTKDVIGILSHAGGFDIAAMCGAFIGAASVRKPVVIDGFISVVAALCAVTLCENVRHYLIPSHESAEPGYLKAIHSLGMQPFLKLDMRLGEGSGCPIAFQIVDAACAVMNYMATFGEAGINDEYLDEIREMENG